MQTHDFFHACSLMLAASVSSVSGAGWVSSVRGQMDSEDLFKTLKATAGVTGVETHVGSFDVIAEYRRYSIQDHWLGLRSVSDELPGGRVRYVELLGHYGIDAQAGVSSLSGWKDFTYGAEASRYWSTPGASVFKAKLGYLNQIDKENPFRAVLTLRSQTADLALNLETGPWIFQEVNSVEFLDAVSKASAASLIQDSTHLQDFPRNRILSEYLYFYRTLQKHFLAGAFASHADSRHDFYAFISSENSMYFPYDTPLDAYSFGGFFSAELNLEDRMIPLGSWSAKITLPFFSRREQSYFYQITAPNGIVSPPIEDHYARYGEEPLTGELRWTKALPGGTHLVLLYGIYVKPYSEYGYFKSESYRMHTVEIRLSRS